ncbi:hypothetical protein ACFE04_031995 [Oxalis oulophora]
MAVQAQYPSNVLLFNNNNRTGTEQNNDYSFQPQQQPGFLDQSSHMQLFNNGGGAINLNTRKRGRRDCNINNTAAGIVAAANINPTPTTTAAILTTTAPIMNPSPFPIQTQQQSSPSPVPPHQFMIDLSQLHNRHPSNNNATTNISTGLHLSFGDHDNHLQPHHYQQQQQQQQQQNFFSYSSQLSDDLTPYIKRQRDELDNYLQLQGEQLRRALAEKRQRHYRTLLNTAEESVSRRLRQKEAEIEKATRRNAELEARAAQLNVEAQVWQAKARSQEASAALLQAQLQQAISNGGCVAAAVDNSATGGGGFEGQVEDAESAYVDPDRVTVSEPSCKTCRKGVATVVVLPCRHLCLCTDCDQVVQACPLCLCVKSSSVEVYLS